jgi:energy-coupling factor transporter ATP-binding protein EcfA2
MTPRFISVQKEGRGYKAIDKDGNIVTGIPVWAMKRAYSDNAMLREYINAATGKIQWRRVDQNKATMETAVHEINNTPSTTQQIMKTDISKILANAETYLPRNMKIPLLSWRFALRSILRGENLLIFGESGCGKTKLARLSPKVLGREFEIFNLGATQEPRSTLIGNTHFEQGRGTYTTPSLFVQMIQRENMVIVLDELSRAHPEAMNILMPVLDKDQRYLRIDESPDTPTIKVAKGVCFIATANVGSEYTGTRVLDRALEDRFSKLYLEPIDKNAEIELLTDMFPTLDADVVRTIAAIGAETRRAVKQENAQIDTIVSTRATIEMAALVLDGFSLADAYELRVYPFYSDQGGTGSPRTVVKQLVQKHLSSSGKNTPFENTADPDDLNNGAQDPFTP